MNKASHTTIQLSPKPSKRILNNNSYAPAKPVNYKQGKIEIDEPLPIVSDWSSSLLISSPVRTRTDERESALGRSPYKQKRRQDFELDSIRKTLQFEEQPFNDEIFSHVEIYEKKVYEPAKPVCLRKLR